MKATIKKAYRKVRTVSGRISALLLGTSLALSVGAPVPEQLTSSIADAQLRQVLGDGYHVIPPSSVPYISLVIDGVILRFKLTNPKLQEENLKVIIVDTYEVNAYALPDDRIVLPIGMLGLIKNESSLGGILGHEIAHIEHHDFENYTAGWCLFRGTELAAFSLGGLPLLLAALPVSRLLEQFTRRHMEYAADSRAVDLLKSSGLNYQEFGAFLGVKMARGSRYNPPYDDLRELTLTHPIMYKRALKVLSQ